MHTYLVRYMQANSQIGVKNACPSVTKCGNDAEKRAHRQKFNETMNLLHQYISRKLPCGAIKSNFSIK